MGVLLGFAPFIVFALMTSVSLSLALWAAFSTAFVITIRDFVQSPTLRVLDAGSTVLFGLLALWYGFIEPGLPIQMARLVVDGGLLAIAIFSLVNRAPFTLEYAREQVPEAVWGSPEFLRTNYIITGVWTVAFAVMTAADATASYHKILPSSLDAAAGLAAMAAAIVFTARYPAYVRAFSAKPRNEARARL